MKNQFCRLKKHEPLGREKYLRDDMKMYFFVAPDISAKADDLVDDLVMRHTKNINKRKIEEKP